MSNIEIFGIILIHVLFLMQLSHNQVTDNETQTKCLIQDSECLTMQAQKTLHLFLEGIPELGIDTVDKLNVEPVWVHLSNFSYVWRNLKVAGLRNAIIDDVNIDMELKIMRVLFHSTLVVDLDCISDGFILDTMPVYGNGKGQITLNNTYIEMLFGFHIVKRNDGKDYMDLKHYNYAFDSNGGVHYHFHDLYDGDKKLSEQFLTLINRNWRIIVANYGGYVNEKISEKIFEAVKLYMSSRPLEDIVVYK